MGLISVTRAGVGTSVSESELGFLVATQAELDNHEADTTDVHGIADTSVLTPEAWVVVGSGGGAPAYTSDYGAGDLAGWETLRFRKLLHNVQLSGHFKKTTAGASGDTLFTLPSGYRPPGTLRLVGVSATTPVAFDVSADGTVVLRFAVGAGGRAYINATFHIT